MTIPPSQPDLEARIAEFAKRLHYHGTNAREQILYRALQALEDSLPDPRVPGVPTRRAPHFGPASENADANFARSIHTMTTTRPPKSGKRNSTTKTGCPNNGS